MDEEDYLHDAVEIVLAWELPEDEFAQAVNQQARLMAGIQSDDVPDRLDKPYRCHDALEH